MNDSTMIQLEQSLAACQKHARVRMMNINSVCDAHGEIVAFLDRSPTGTSVRGPLWRRVANSYRGIPEGTSLTGEKLEDGSVEIAVFRGTDAFGSRSWIVRAPDGYVARGPDTHTSTGSTDDLRTTVVVEK